jgi:hypothetical protein
MECATIAVRVRQSRPRNVPPRRFDALLRPKAEPPKPEPRDAKLVPLLVDGVVCAAAEVASQPPGAVRELLRVAFQRAQAAGLSVETIVKGLGRGGGRA